MLLFSSFFLFFFFFNDTATTEIYTLSLHDALPISPTATAPRPCRTPPRTRWCWGDRKSTRLNSSHVRISYAVFCLKKKKKKAWQHSKKRILETNKHGIDERTPCSSLCPSSGYGTSSQVPSICRSSLAFFFF